MALLQMVVDQVVGWLIIAAYLLVPGVVAALLWAPFLGSNRIRSLFKQLPPSDSLVVTYVIVGVAASLPFILGLLGVIVTATPNSLWGPPILHMTLMLSICYVVVIPVIGGLWLPRLGIDWDPNGYDMWTWIILAAGGVWYTAIFAVPLTILAVVLSLPGGY